MNYRFQKFTSVYPAFAQQFLARNPGYEQLSYQELYDKFINTQYGLSNFYEKHMKALGNEAQDIFASFEHLQKLWAEKNGLRYEGTDWLKSIVIAQVKSFQPDVVYLQDLYLFDQNFRRQLREALRKRVIMIGWRAAPTKDFTVFNDLDLVLSAGPHLVQMFQRCGANAMYLPLAFEDTLVEVLGQVRERDLDFTFAGNLGNRNGAHSQRYHLIERLIASSPIEVWSDIDGASGQSRTERLFLKGIYHTNRSLAAMGVPQKIRASLPLIRGGDSWLSDPTLPTLNQLYPGRIYRSVFGVENYEISARSKIALNSHIDCFENYAGNMRLYEVTGMGACLLTDWKINLSELFEPEVEVVTYRSVEECIEKVSYLLGNETERQAIAAAGQKRTLRDHTYRQRVGELHQTILKLLRK
jgi:spore maturation protein CgeB